MCTGLKYPLLLVHGMGFRDFKRVNYWGRIPAALQKAGALIYYGQQDSNGSIEANAQQLASQIDKALADAAVDKLNIIAHSKGGLEARYLISTLGYAGKVASLTTLSTPHHGSITVDELMRFPQPLIRFGCKMVDLWFRLLGDKSPSTYEAVRAFQTENAKNFNVHNPDMPQVYYQSYSFVMKKAGSDWLMSIPYWAVKHYEGDNDGLLAPRATQWTNYKGVYSGVNRRGISHMDEIDFRRKPLSKKQGDGVTDITDLYVAIVRDLGSKNF